MKRFDRRTFLQSAAGSAPRAESSAEAPGTALPASEISSLMSQLRLQAARTSKQE